MAGHLTSHATKALSLAIVMVALLMRGTASAQSDRIYAGATIMLTTQGGHRQGSAPSLPTSGAGGTAVGATVESGVRLTPRIAVGVELSVPCRFVAVQDTHYTRVFQQESRHRDLALSGVVRAMFWPARRIRLGLVGGGGFVQEHTLQRQREQLGPFPTFPPTYGPYSATSSFTRWTVAALAGADVEIGATSRVFIVPQFRAHVVRRSGDPSRPGWALGLDGLVLRPGVGIRVAF
jgi:hypothetical protein